MGGFEGGYFDLARPYDAEVPTSCPRSSSREYRFPELRDTQFWANARAVTARLLGVDEADLYGWGHMIDKPPRHGHETPWHQDESYWDPAFDYRAVGAWLALDDVDEDNGCMCFIPGSHRGEVLEHRHIGDDPAVHGLWTEHADPSTAVAVPLMAGGATFHHPRTLHHTPPNRTDRRRRAYANEFQTKPVRRAEPAVRPWVADGKAKWDERAVIAEGSR